AALERRAVEITVGGRKKSRAGLASVAATHGKAAERGEARAVRLRLVNATDVTSASIARRAIQYAVAGPYQRAFRPVALADAAVKVVQRLVAAAVFVQPENDAVEMETSILCRSVEIPIRALHQAGPKLLSVVWPAEMAQHPVAGTVGVGFENNSLSC